MLQWFYLIIELWLCSSGGNIGATQLLLRHWCESLSIPMDHMNSFNSLNHSSRWTRNNDTMWQSSTVTLCYHATHCVTELVYGGFSMYRGWFVLFLHSFYALSASEKPSVKCFFLSLMKMRCPNCDQKRKRDRKDIHTSEDSSWYFCVRS